MPDPRKAAEVDGFRVLQAVRHGKEQGGKRPPPETPLKPPVEPGIGKKPHFGKTALPTKHEVTCYACDYVFPIAGRVRTLICPKCRLTLDQNDYTVDTESRETIRTTGTLRLTPDGILQGGALVAQHIVLEGRVEGGQVRALGLLELGGTQVLGGTPITGRDLRVAAGATVQFNCPGAFRNLDLHGTLHGRMEIAGLATIHAGGHLVGHLSGRRLVVEEGGGLEAAVEIRAG